MDRDERIDLLFLNDRDKSRPPIGVAASRTIDSSLKTPKEYRNRAISNAVTSPTLSSSSRRSDSDTASQRSSVSSASEAPSIHIAPPWHKNPPINMMAIEYNYDLPCEFEHMLGCHIRFPPERFDDWIAHSVWHFDSLPPPRSTCIFCDSSHSPFDNWRDRMLHIGAHYQDQENTRLGMRPDYFVIEHLYANGLLSTQDYEWNMSYTERPYCDDLVEAGFQSPEMVARKRRNVEGTERPHDLRKERRQMRKEGEKGKGSRYETHRPSHRTQIRQER